MKQLKLWKQLNENQSERQRKRISKGNFPIPRSAEETTQKCEGREVVHMASPEKGQIFSSAENASHLLNLSHMGKDVDILKDQNPGKCRLDVLKQEKT